MDSRPNISIDAGVIAVPPVDSEPEKAFEYVDTLLDWSKLLGEPWVAVHVSERATDVLFEAGLYPLREHLKKLFDSHGIEEYSVNDIATVAERLLSITPSFETYYRIVDVLTEVVETDPDVIRLTTHQALQVELARCIIIIAILRKHCVQPLGGHSLILRSAPKDVIHVRAEVHDIEHSRDDIPAIPISPDVFEGNVLACDNFRGLIACLDEGGILISATDDVGIELSIRIAIYKSAVIQGLVADWDSALVPKIGMRFRETCQQCCADKAESLPAKVLRAITETVNGEKLSAVHGLRSGGGGNDPVKVRGRDRAQRRDIDKEFHLHYWQCEDGSIELASVVYHNDFSIPG